MFSINQLTPYQVQWFKKRYPKHLKLETIRLFKERFGIELTIRQLRAIKHKYGIRDAPLHGPGRRYTPEAKEVPVFTEHVNQHGVVLIKIPGPRLDGEGRFNWKRKATWVWEKKHGKVPKDYCVFQLDGDKLNCELSNLEIMPKSVLGYMRKIFERVPGKDMYSIKLRLAELAYLTNKVSK